MEDTTRALTQHSGDGHAESQAPQPAAPSLPAAGPVQLESLDDVFRLAEVFAHSGYFSDARETGQAVTKMLAGAERGISPVASMTGIYVIKGKITMGADIIAKQLKRHPKYDYRVAELSDDRCVIHFFEGGEKIGESTFDRRDAKKAGTQNMRKFPRNMLFARAMTNGVKWYCPDAVDGDVYTPEEMGVPVDGQGAIEEAYWEDVSPEPQQQSLPRKGEDEKVRREKELFQKGLARLRDRIEDPERDLKEVIDASYVHARDEWGWTGERMEGFREMVADVQQELGVEVYQPTDESVKAEEEDAGDTEDTGNAEDTDAPDLDAFKVDLREAAAGYDTPEAKRGGVNKIARAFAAKYSGAAQGTQDAINAAYQEVLDEIAPKADAPASDYDPDAAPALPKDDTAPRTALPEDFPYAGKIEEAGITTAEGVLAAGMIDGLDDLTDVPGIGEERAKEVREAAQALLD